MNRSLRDDALVAIRPVINGSARDSHDLDGFQEESLRPIITLQSGIIASLVNSRIAAADSDVEPTSVLQDPAVRDSLIGVIIGHLTAEELAIYLEIDRRLLELLHRHIEDRQGVPSSL